MSSISGGGIPPFQPPSFNEASGVIGQIETVCGSISDLFAEVQSLLRDIQDLQANKPQPPVRGAKESDESWNKRMGDFTKAMNEFQSRLADLNRRIEDTYRKLGMAQAKLQQLQGRDLPAAERRDAEKLKKACEDAVKALNEAAKVVKQTGGAGEEGGETRVAIRVEEKKFEINMSDFKSVINGFALMASFVGLPKTDNPFTRVPHTPGSGLPPAGMP